MCHKQEKKNNFLPRFACQHLINNPNMLSPLCYEWDKSLYTQILRI